MDVGLRVQGSGLQKLQYDSFPLRKTMALKEASGFTNVVALSLALKDCSFSGFFPDPLKDPKNPPNSPLVYQCSNGFILGGSIFWML